MKFYEPEIVYTGMGECNPRMLEDCDGQWATRADAEQAAKDAVEMARMVQKYQRAASINFWHELSVTEAIKKAEETEYHKQAQAIINKYKEIT